MTVHLVWGENSFTDSINIAYQLSGWFIIPKSFPFVYTNVHNLRMEYGEELYTINKVYLLRIHVHAGIRIPIQALLV